MTYSIIIPTLNEEKLLPFILNQIKESCICEKFDAELIISDGGSSDGTLEIAGKYTNKIILPNPGSKQNIAAGRNAGVIHSKGDILVFLGADIKFNNILDFFSYVDNKFKNSKYLAMTCNVKIFPEEEKLSDIFFHFLLNNYFYLLNVFGEGMGRGECQVIRKKVFDEMNGYNEKLAAGEDYDLFRRARKKGKILYEKKFCVYESPRRYRRFGYLNVCKSWFINAYYVVIKKRSMSEEWEQIR